MSPQIIIFMEFVYSWSRMDSKKLKKFEKFPVGGLSTHKIQNTKEEMCNFTAQTSRS